MFEESQMKYRWNLYKFIKLFSKVFDLDLEEIK